MAAEIERKFLVDTALWQPPATGQQLSQGYLSLDPERTVRVRIADAQAFLTIKGKTTGICRSEFEYAIPLADAAQLLTLCAIPPIEKTRYCIEYEGFVWEVDVFAGVNAGLVLAEIELPDEQTPFAKPLWATQEVSHDKCYYNSYLNQHPYTTWSQHEPQ